MTRVANLKRFVAGAMEDVAEDQSQGCPRLSSVEPGHQMLGAEEEKESNVTCKKGTRVSYKKCNHIFPGNN